MFTIEKATTNDFERIYPQLRQSFGDSLSRDEWRKIFVYRWRSDEGFCGYMLLKDGEVKGFLSLLFSNRILDKQHERFCNLSSWCVSEDSRGQSLALMLEALKLKGYTFTNFTPSTTVAAILSKLGFTEFAVDHQVVFPLPDLHKQPQCHCEFDPRKIRSLLNQRHAEIFDDHQGFNCRHLLLQSNNDYCYVIVKKTWRKRIPFAKIHFLSDPEIFVRCIERAGVRISLRLGVAGVMVDERYLKGRKLSRSVSYPHQRKAYFKSSLDSLDSNQIDTLYSEMVVLHN